VAPVRGDNLEAVAAKQSQELAARMHHGLAFCRSHSSPSIGYAAPMASRTFALAFG
jgi:hypothetical protein